MDVKLSQVDMVDPDELDEEFDTFPSSRPPEVIRVRYDRLRILAARVQTVLGDFATQGERIQALVSWRDPRATKLFIGVCFAITIILYVVPPKMVAVALGFYFLRHPMFRDPMPPASLSFFRRLPGLSDSQRNNDTTAEADKEKKHETEKKDELKDEDEKGEEDEEKAYHKETEDTDPDEKTAKNPQDQKDPTTVTVQ
ncbi:protein QUIRKY [Sesamum angolense]|uniref:Protein QUIRKY n=1 Tax=Sesamum angolense TaxID=2727404 RepID=A0AAE1T5G0_9LAMI|nr:protein QUIRKY [Sesamum angolense]